MSAPDPAVEIRMTTLHATRGANYWSRGAVTRMDLIVGAYADISSADVPGFTEALVSAMPGLEAHRCSIGERGGFIVRLNDGTYAAHIVEHVALELQTMIGHDVGYGRAREGDVPTEFTVVFEHMHESVGLRAGALALETVQQAFAGKLQSVEHAVAELRALAETPDVPPLVQNVLCGITGGANRAVARDEIVRRGFGSNELLIDVSPAYLLQAGLPYAHSEIGIILDATLTDVPERYRDPERAQRLVSILADAVDSDGIMIVPAKEWEIQDRVRDAGPRVAVFSANDDITRRDRKVARASAFPRDGRIMIESRRRLTDAGELRDDIAPGPQVAAALAVYTLEEGQSMAASSVATANR